MTVGAALFAVPLGVAAAMFIAEVAPRWLREILKPLVEILAGLPSVVLGFLGILVLVAAIRETLGLPTGLTALHRLAAAGRDGAADDRQRRRGRARRGAPRPTETASLALGATALADASGASRSRPRGPAC